MDDLSGELREELVLADLVNRVLDRGVTVVGEVVISVAGVDLVHLGLRLDLASIETTRQRAPWMLPNRPPPLPPGGGVG
jgi:hypothetical protein